MLARPFHFVTRFEFISVFAAFVLCVSLCAILCFVTFLIQRDLHRTGSENLWSNPVFAMLERFSQVLGVEGRAAFVKIDALAVCNLGHDASEVLSMRTGPDGVGVSAVGTGESIFDTALSCLAHRLRWHTWVPCSIGSGW